MSQQTRLSDQILQDMWTDWEKGGGPPHLTPVIFSLINEALARGAEREEALDLLQRLSVEDSPVHGENRREAREFLEKRPQSEGREGDPNRGLVPAEKLLGMRVRAEEAESKMGVFQSEAVKHFASAAGYAKKAEEAEAALAAARELLGKARNSINDLMESYPHYVVEDIDAFLSKPSPAGERIRTMEKIAEAARAWDRADRGEGMSDDIIYTALQESRAAIYDEWEGTKGLISPADEWVAHIDAALEELATLREQRERLTPWLRHKSVCRSAEINVVAEILTVPVYEIRAWSDGDEETCTCGLAAALGLK